MSDDVHTSGPEQELAYLRAEVEHLRRRLGTEGSTDSRLTELESRLSATNSQTSRKPEATSKSRTWASSDRPR